MGRSAHKDMAKYLTKEELDYNQKKNAETGRSGTAITVSHADLERLHSLQNSLGLKTPAEVIRYMTCMIMPLVQDCYKNQAEIMIKKLVDNPPGTGA
tara:strand:+ start:320 stop:610 length:291 start_codon:yes stop_codon:yes gene_type:complete